MVVSKREQGFTLIESIIAIIVLAVAMVTLTSFLFPQIQQSGRPHYQVRASALAQSVMTEVLARGFDHHSDFDGGWVRCGESDAPEACTPQAQFGPDITDGETNPGFYNDVDDYLGCWVTNSASQSLCNGSIAGNLNDIFGRDISSSYPNFAVNIDVAYQTLTGVTSSDMKVITVSVVSSSYGDITVSAYRGNY